MSFCDPRMKARRMTASPLGTGSAVYENDILGNRSWRNHNVNTNTVVKYKWDELNRMTCLQGTSDGATCTYRADGMRTRKVTGIYISYNVDDEGVVSGYYDGFSTDRPTWRYYYDGQAPIEDDWTRKVSNVTTVDVTRQAVGARGNWRGILEPV